MSKGWGQLTCYHVLRVGSLTPTHTFSASSTVLHRSGVGATLPSDVADEGQEQFSFFYTLQASSSTNLKHWWVEKGDISPLFMLPHDRRLTGTALPYSHHQGWHTNRVFSPVMPTQSTGSRARHFLIYFILLNCNVIFKVDESRILEQRGPSLLSRLPDTRCWPNSETRRKRASR